MKRAVLLLLLLFGIGLVVRVYAFRSVTELDVYRRAAERYVAGDDIYVRVEGEPAFSYPPAFALPTVPLLVLPETAQRVAWCLANLALAITLLVLTGRIMRTAIGAGTSHEHLWFWLLAALAGLRFILAPLANQSHDLIIAVLVVGGAFALARARDGLGGVLFGVAAALKATPLLALPVLVVQRRFLAAGAMAGAILVTSAIPDLVHPPPESWRLATWIDIARGAAQPGQSGGSDIWRPWNELNQNLSGTLFRLTATAPDGEGTPGLPLVALSDDARRVVTTGAQGLVFVAVVLIGFHARRRGRREPEASAWFDALAIAAVTCGMLLLSPMTSKAHYAVLALAVGVLVGGVLRDRRPLQIGLLALVVALSTFTAKGLVGKALGDTLLAYGCTTGACVALLVAITARVFGPVPRRADEAAATAV